MAERPAVNASPLILLARAGLLDFLQLAGPEIVVPSAVADEIRREGPNDPAVRALEATAWLKVVEAAPLPAVIQGWDLGAGESAVLAWAHAHPGTLAIVDDLAGRRCAAAPLRCEFLSAARSASCWSPSNAAKSRRRGPFWNRCAPPACTCQTRS